MGTGYFEPTRIIDKPDMLPGICDVFGCPHPARYCFATSYYCAEHLIDCMDKGGIPKGSTIWRVPVYELC